MQVVFSQRTIGQQENSPNQGLTLLSSPDTLNITSAKLWLTTVCGKTLKTIFVLSHRADAWDHAEVICRRILLMAVLMTGINELGGNTKVGQELQRREYEYQRKRLIRCQLYELLRIFFLRFQCGYCRRFFEE